MDLATLTPGRPDTCPHLASYLAQIRDGRVCRVELYPDKPVHDRVERYAVLKLLPNLYRAVVLYRYGLPGGVGLHGFEGSLNDVARSLRVLGVPVLRVQGPARS